MSKHTPGPWTAQPNGAIWVGDTLISVCAIAPEEATANANLIAAAPDLLEALQLVVDKIGTDFELYSEQQFAIDNARAAIAKATGAA